MKETRVLIIGGGVAGLTCAAYLQQRGIDFLLVEASSQLGGKLRTSAIDGYLLDHGFQVLQTNYPEVQRLLNFEALQLGSFASGAKIYYQEHLYTFANPFRHALGWVTMPFSPVGTLRDKWLLGQLILDVKSLDSRAFFSTPSPQTTIDFLRQYGFSATVIDNFFRPFFGGVFLEEELKTASNFFKFTYKQFFEGNASLPANGMQAIAQQIAFRLPQEAILLNSAVEKLLTKGAVLANGQEIKADVTVIATDSSAAEQLLMSKTSLQRSYHGTQCFYYATDKPLEMGDYLTLNPNRKQLVHHYCQPSAVAPTYAPAGKSLISVTTRLKKQADATDEAQVRKELAAWHPSASSWQLLQPYWVPQSLAAYEPKQVATPYQVANRIYRCGDYLLYPSLNAAMQSGREVAELVGKIV